MPAPQTNFVASTDKAGYDLATLSDDEDDGYSQSSRSTWASASDATILGFADGNLNSGEPDESDWRVSRIGGLPVRRYRRLSRFPNPCKANSIQTPPFRAVPRLPLSILRGRSRSRLPMRPTKQTRRRVGHVGTECRS